MPQYMLLMYNDAESDKQFRESEPSAEEMAAEHKRWIQFTKELKDAGLLVANHGLAGVDAATTVRRRDGETQITDGPFAETKELFAGYFLIQADDLDTALKYAARVPSLEHGGSVEVRPVWGE